jgi:hypothetical protein
MKLPNQVTITLPKTSDQKGNLITPPSFNLEFIQINYIDSPSNKNVSAHIFPFPLPLKLWQGSEYELIGDWTQKQAEDRVLELLGADIQKSLNDLYPPTLENDPDGPGSILSKMLSRIGIKSSPTCGCKQRAITMNKNGIEWCENNIDTILGWLKEESAKRNIPFVEIVAKVVVSRAINKSKKLKQNNR